MTSRKMVDSLFTQQSFPAVQAEPQVRAAISLSTVWMTAGNATRRNSFLDLKMLCVAEIASTGAF